MKKFLSFSYLASLFFILWFQTAAFAQVPNLNSRPTSTFVLYLDFDGHSDNSGWWSSLDFPDPVVTAASTFSSAQITEVFNRVSEDYRPFDLNVTTQASVYNAALASKRQRIVITANSEFYTNENGGAGGVAYLNTFGGGEIAGYVFTNFLGGSAKNTAEAASHEAGHTLGLNHHSRFNSDCTYDIEYNPGQGSGQTDWAPIMGNGYGANMTLWYHGATNEATCTAETQNDLNVITTNNGFSYRTDEAGNTAATSSNLAFAGSVATTKGIITTATDVDVYKITVSAPGFYNVAALPTSHNTTGNVGANLDIKLWIANAAGTTIFTADPTTTLDASLANIALPLGVYYVFIDGVGNASYTAIGGLGSLDYGSIGEYTLTATRLCTPVITAVSGASRCGTGSVSLSATATAGTINWYSAATGGSLLGTGASFPTPALSTTTTYFAGSTAAGCATPSERVAVTATINTIPLANAGPDLVLSQNSGSTTLSSSPAGGTWTGTGVNSAGVFNTANPPGNYVVQYCVANNTCTRCDSANITITGTATVVSNPVISPGTGSYTSTQNVVITCPTPGAQIYYTTTGNTPVVGTGFTRLYTGPIQMAQTGTIKAMAIKSGLGNSGVVSAYYTINNQNITATPVISPPTGSYNGQQAVTITCATPGATIYYTTNGNIPSAGVNSFTKIYTGSFMVNTTQTVRALAVSVGRSNSAVAVSFITITNPTQTVATPVITPATGSFLGSQSVTITCATPGSTIYYTTSGNTPVVGTGYTRLYAGSFPLAISATVRAMATAPGQINSGVAVSYITISGGGARLAVDAEDSKANLSLYPNPSDGVFKIKHSGEMETWHAELFDVLGKSVRVFEINPDTELLDLTQEKDGIYMLRLHTHQTMETYRLIKK